MQRPVSAIGVGPASRPLPDSHAAVIRRFIDDVVNRGDYSGLKDLIHRDYVYRTPDQTLRGSEAIQSLMNWWQRVTGSLWPSR
jgi:hypothetical protein